MGLDKGRQIGGSDYSRWSKWFGTREFEAVTQAKPILP